MAKRSSQILFALLLLLSQTALVSHDVQHLDSNHEECCAVYAAQDHSADKEFACALQKPNFYLQDTLVRVSAFTESSVKSAYASRAPPTAFSHQKLS